MYLPTWQTQTYLQYTQPAAHHTVPPTKAIPVTIVTPQPEQIRIKLPFAKTTTPIPTISTPPYPQPYLLHQLINPSKSWEQPLWRNVHPQQDLYQLANKLTKGIPILLSTDAAMNAAKCSSFAWTIYSTQALWKGSGAVPGPYEDAHLTRSEAFGILTMLRFLLQYLSRFPLVLTTAHPIALYCDNQGILQRLAPQNTKIHPKARSSTTMT